MWREPSVPVDASLERDAEAQDRSGAARAGPMDLVEACIRQVPLARRRSGTSERLNDLEEMAIGIGEPGDAETVEPHVWRRQARAAR